MILLPDRLIEVGQVRKTHGVDGALRATVEEAFREYVWDLEFLFLDIDGDKVPFRIEYIKGEEDAPIFKFDRMDTPEEAAKYTGAKLFMEKDRLPKGFDPAVSSELEFAYLEGFTLFDEGIGLIGPILEVMEYPQQEMAVVNYRENEWLIPLHEDLIIAVDENNRRITMRLPEGLFEMG